MFYAPQERKTILYNMIHRLLSSPKGKGLVRLHSWLISYGQRESGIQAIAPILSQKLSSFFDQESKSLVIDISKNAGTLIFGTVTHFIIDIPHFGHLFSCLLKLPVQYLGSMYPFELLW